MKYGSQGLVSMCFLFAQVVCNQLFTVISLKMPRPDLRFQAMISNCLCRQKIGAFSLKMPQASLRSSREFSSSILLQQLLLLAAAGELIPCRLIEWHKGCQ